MTNIVEISIRRFVSPPLLLSLSLSHSIASFIHTRFHLIIARFRSHALSRWFRISSGQSSGFAYTLGQSRIHLLRSTRQFIYTQIQENKLATKQILSKNKRSEFILM